MSRTANGPSGGTPQDAGSAVADDESPKRKGWEGAKTVKSGSNPDQRTKPLKPS